MVKQQRQMPMAGLVVDGVGGAMIAYGNRVHTETSTSEISEYSLVHPFIYRVNTKKPSSTLRTA